MDEEKQRIDFKLGWIQGVLIPCLLNIWGVMLFLRISWVVAQAGVGLSLIIIAMSYFVCVITTLSMSALCTNGEVQGGGIYYIISRSLGPEFGASVGIVFAFANAVSASMNTIGFCDSLNELLESKGLKIIDNSINDVRIVGSVTLLLLCIICAVGMDWESMTQNFLIVIIVTAIINFIIGAVIGPTNDDSIAKGFVGLKSALFEENFKPDFRYSEGRDHNFFSAFAIFFPSVTGIQAGANISGDLKDPGTAIPKGTLLSLLISMASYVAMVLLTGGGALRDASGNMTDPGIAGNYSVPPDCVETGCKYGIHNSYAMMQVMALWSPLIYGGCWAATLSTALTNVIAVPRLIQALGIDRVYPGLIFFSKAYGRHGEPYRGYILCLSVSLMFLLFMDLNSVAPLITNFFLASYALLNFCTFHAGFICPLGWRPTFRYYNLWLSLLGCLMCVAIMLLINWVMFLVTLGIFLFLYLVVHYRNPDINWGSSTQAQMYKRALAAAHNLTWTGEHVKNYWPQVLVLAGQPHVRPALVDLGSLITKAGSLMVVGDISQEKLSCEERAARSRVEYDWLRERKVRAFYTNVNGFSFETGARALMQATGVGRLTPDVLLIGYKADWTTAPPEELITYFNVLHTAFQIRLAVAIIRISGGLDYGSETAREGVGSGMKGTSRASTADSNLNIHAEQPTPTKLRKLTERILNLSHHSIVGKKERKQTPQSTDGIILHDHRQKNYQYPKVENEQQMTIFQMKHMINVKNSYEVSLQGSGTLDVWWLYDDGGMTILLPYIISQRSAWAKCKIRVFALPSQEREIKIDEKHIANLLTKYRIKYSSLEMVQDITVPPQQETRTLFKDLTKKFKLGSGPEECQISEAEMVSLEDKTNRQLRLRELLLANSKNARLIVLSLPMPRKGSVSVPLYMAWLEMLSRDMPPVLFVRGNNANVLTFYF